MSKKPNIKITAKTVEEFQEISRKIELINNNDLIEKFEVAENGVLNLTFSAPYHMCFNKINFSRKFNIRKISVRPITVKIFEKDETRYHVEVYGTYSPEEEKPFDVSFHFNSHEVNIEVSAF